MLAPERLTLAIAAPDLAQGVTPPAEQPHRPWLVPRAGRL
jgi:hypothetical protein